MGSISHGGHERGKRGDGDLTRARILESAGQLAAECGYANMTSKQTRVPVLSMHAPWETTSKADVYEAYKGYLAFLKNM